MCVVKGQSHAICNMAVPLVYDCKWHCSITQVSAVCRWTLYGAMNPPHSREKPHYLAAVLQAPDLSGTPCSVCSTALRGAGTHAGCSGSGDFICIVACLHSVCESMAARACLCQQAGCRLSRCQTPFAVAQQDCIWQSTHQAAARCLQRHDCCLMCWDWQSCSGLDVAVEQGQMCGYESSAPQEQNVLQV